MDVDEEDEGPPRRGGRVRAAPERHRPQRDVECGPTGRPAADERRRANELIDVMLHLKMLRGKAVAVTTNVIALAIAWIEDRATFDAVGNHDNNVLFGLPPRSETRRDWVDDVQRRLAQAQEWLALSAQARLNFRPSLWTAADVAEHHKQGVHMPVPFPFLARAASSRTPEQRRDEQKQKQATQSEARAIDMGRAARPRHRRQACGVGTSVSTLLGLFIIVLLYLLHPPTAPISAAHACVLPEALAASNDRIVYCAYIDEGNGERYEARGTMRPVACAVKSTPGPQLCVKSA